MQFFLGLQPYPSVAIFENPCNTMKNFLLQQICCSRTLESRSSIKTKPEESNELRMPYHLNKRKVTAFPWGSIIMSSQLQYHEVLVVADVKEATKYRSTLTWTFNKTLDTIDCVMLLQGSNIFFFSSFAGLYTINAYSLEKQIFHFAQWVWGSWVACFHMLLDMHMAIPKFHKWDICKSFSC